MNDPSRAYTRDFGSARTQFLAAAATAGATIETWQHPLRGRSGEKLFTDAAWLGPPDARKVFVTISATHGIEGHVGSMCQSAWLAEGYSSSIRDAGMAHLAIHAINPYGFAWSRRVTEDNVDLNRNFVDFDAPLPVNEGYRDLHHAVLPAQWTEATRREAQDIFDRYRQAHGEAAYRRALIGGQYEFPDGIYFGGQGRTWSHRRMQAIFEDRLAGAEAIAVIDYHSGLGPYGYGEIIGGNPIQHPDFPLLADWFGGEATSGEAGTTRSAALHGKNSAGMRRFVPSARIVNVTLEFGTMPSPRVLSALRADNWLHVHGDLSGDLSAAIRAEMHHCFNPEDPAWRTAVWVRARDVSTRTVAGLGSI